jgi:hypothetical protein
MSHASRISYPDHCKHAFRPDRDRHFNGLINNMIAFLVYHSEHVNRLLVSTKEILRSRGENCVFIALSHDAYEELTAFGETAIRYYEFPDTHLETNRLLATDGKRPVDESTIKLSSEADIAWINQGEVRDDGPIDPRRREELEAVLNTMHQLVACVRPTCAVLWNGERAVGRSMRLLAARYGFQTCFIERGPFPDTVFFDKEGTNGAAGFLGNKLRTPSSKDKSWAYTKIQQYLDSNSSAWPQPPRLEGKSIKEYCGIPPENSIAFLPLQVNADTNMILHSPLFASADELFLSLAPIFEQSKGTSLVVKNHPMELHPVPREQIVRHRNCFALDQVSVKQILFECDYVIANNSTVAFEALFYGKPVILTGTAFFSQQGLTEDVSSISSLSPAIEKISTSGPQPDLMRHALNFLAELRENRSIFDVGLPEHVVQFTDLLSMTAKAGGESAALVDAGVAAMNGRCDDLANMQRRLAEYDGYFQRVSQTSVGAMIAKLARIRGARGFARLMNRVSKAAIP